MDRALTLAEETNAAVNELEVRVKATEEALDEKIDKAEERISTHVDDKVKTMVVDQLRAAGFDPDLTASGLSTINVTNQVAGSSYATAARTGTSVTAPTDTMNVSAPAYRSKEDRQEEKFHLCRRSLRLWPVSPPTRQGWQWTIPF